MTAAEAARLAGVTETVIAYWVATGRLRPYPDGRFSATAVLAAARH